MQRAAVDLCAHAGGTVDLQGIGNPSIGCGDPAPQFSGNGDLPSHGLPGRDAAKTICHQRPIVLHRFLLSPSRKHLSLVTRWMP